VFDAPEDPWQIVPFGFKQPEDRFIEFPDRPAFVRFLRQYKSDRRVMLHLRGVLTPPIQISKFDDDEVIEMIAAKVAAHHLAIRERRRKEDQDVVSEGGGGGGGDSQQRSDSTPNVAQPLNDDSPSKPTRSWFSITVVHEMDGAEKVVDGLTIHCELPDLGKTSGMTSRNTPHIRFNDLNPGGTGDVLATSHDDVVWEVTADIY
jgi:hypothetical protein